MRGMGPPDPDPRSKYVRRLIWRHERGETRSPKLRKRGGPVRGGQIRRHRASQRSRRHHTPDRAIRTNGGAYGHRRNGQYATGRGYRPEPGGETRASSRSDMSASSVEVVAVAPTTVTMRSNLKAFGMPAVCTGTIADVTARSAMGRVVRWRSEFHVCSFALGNEMLR